MGLGGPQGGGGGARGGRGAPDGPLRVGRRPPRPGQGRTGSAWGCSLIF